MSPDRSSRLATAAWQACLFVAALAPTALGAEERPPMNVVVVALESLGDFATPLRSMDDVLPNRELHARVSPNLQELAERSVVFTNAQSPGLGYQHGIETCDLERLERRPGRRVERSPWQIDGPFRLRWSRLVPAGGESDTPTIAEWEALTASLYDPRAAAHTASQIDREGPMETNSMINVVLRGAEHPWRAPGVFFDRFPIEEVAPPRSQPSDDLPDAARRYGDWETQASLDAATPDDRLAWRSAIQARLATVAYADYALGAIIDAVDAANAVDDPESRHWALIVCSTRGPCLGERGVWGSNTPWEQSTRVIFMVHTPGGAARRIATPINLEAWPPAVIELIGNDLGPNSEGLMPLLAKRGDRLGVVVRTDLPGGAYTVRSQRFRLVHYAEGAEELYDLEKDPQGFYNLLHESNAERLEPFGLSATQVEAVREWLAMRAAGEAEPTGVPGDFTGDGVVNAADSSLWRDQLGKEVPVGTGGDGDHDGRVERDDRQVWLDNFGRRAE